MAVALGRRSLSRRIKGLLLIVSLLSAISATAVVTSSGNATGVRRNAPASELGYWLASRSGRVSAYGGAKVYGSVSGLAAGQSVVAIAGAADGAGYWVLTNKGRVFAFGGTKHYGGLAGRHPIARPGAALVAIAPTAGAKGYWLADTRGQVYSFGHAHFFGPRHLLRLKSAVTSMVADPRGGGYWLLTRRGQVLGFGDAHVYGSVASGQGANVIAMAATPDGNGYWVVTRKGKVRGFGDAQDYGSAPDSASGTVVGIAPTPDGAGYWLVNRDGAVRSFGDARGQALQGHRVEGQLQVAGIAPMFRSAHSGGPASHGAGNGRGRASSTTTTASSGTTVTTLQPGSTTTLTTGSTSTSTSSSSSTTLTAQPATSTTAATTTSTTAAFAATSTSSITSSTTGTTATSTVPGAGENYQVCTDPQARADYLTSPWTYDALAAGSQSYTASQYEALSGYGTILPPLPSYLANLSGDVAEIVAPGISASAAVSPYSGAMLYFFEGGYYGGGGGGQMASGDLVIGGSAPGYPEPQVDLKGGSFASQNDHFNETMGYGQLASSVNSSTIVTAAPGFYAGQYPDQIVFANGKMVGVSNISGNTITLSGAITESAGANFWLVGTTQLLGTVAAAAQGATSISVSPNTTSLPYVPYDELQVSVTMPDGQPYSVLVRIASASGSTLTLAQPLPQSVPANSAVMYEGSGATTGDVTIEYMDLYDGSQGPGIIQSGPGWVIEHNYIHDTYAGGTAYATTNAAGTAIFASSDYDNIEYNCLQRLGEYGLNGGGVGTVFDYNQVDQTPYNPDLSGNGQTGCGKWWGTLNNDLVDNAFTDEYRSVCIWFDNGNTGMLVQGNYFDNINNRAIQNETGYNSEYVGNLFEDVSVGIYLNDSGGWNIPGSRYNDEVVVRGNTFYNALQAINIWGASGRSCLNSGEAAGPESDPYCSGGYPQMPPTDQYFTHYFDSGLWAMTTAAANETCSTSSPCSTVTLSGAPAVNDWIGFSGQAPNGCSVSSPCGNYAADPVQTSTTDTTNVSDLTGSGTVSVASSAGFPSSGRLIADTSCGSLYLATGAVLSYAGDTPSSFTGVRLVSGCGTLSGTIEAVQPYHVTAVSCPGGSCVGNAVVSVSPAITSDLTAGTAVYSTGTCPYYVTAAATPSSPKASNGTSYYDGCMWENRNISVEGNTFDVDPAQFNATPLAGQSGDWSCDTGPGGNCAQNAMGYQYPGGDAAPYNNPILANAMMSDSTLPAPYDNLNASGSPLVGAGTGTSANGEQPYDDLWIANTYIGDWTFQAYTQAAGCPIDWTGSALKWVGGTGGNACSGLSLAQWQSIWHQD